MSTLVVHIGPAPKPGKKYLVRCRLAAYDTDAYLSLLTQLGEKGHFGGFGNMVVSILPRGVTRESILMGDVYLEVRPADSDRRADLDALVAAWKERGVTVDLRTLTKQQYQSMWQEYSLAKAVATNQNSQRPENN